MRGWGSRGGHILEWKITALYKEEPNEKLPTKLTGTQHKNTMKWYR
jgi:hypothetical protein